MLGLRGLEQTPRLRLALGPKWGPVVDDSEQSIIIISVIVSIKITLVSERFNIPLNFKVRSNNIQKL